MTLQLSLSISLPVDLDTDTDTELDTHAPMAWMTQPEYTACSCGHPVKDCVCTSPYIGVPCHICRFHLDVCKCDKTYEDTPSVFTDFTGPSLWEAAMQAFTGTPNIPSKFTTRCYTPFQEDYKRILIFSSPTTRYEVYNYHIPEK
jgi:hypothetical protein